MAQVQSNQLGIEVLLLPITAPAINVGQLGVEILLHPVPPPQIQMNQYGLEVMLPYIPPSAYNVFNFTTMPSSPLPSSIQVSLLDATEANEDDYTGQVVTYPYESRACEVTIFLPTIQDPTIQSAWVTWLATTCKQQAVFQLPSFVEGLISSPYSTTWWRLKPGQVEMNFVPGGLGGGQLLENQTFTIRSLSAADASMI
jgi:hypothetical protein